MAPRMQALAIVFVLTATMVWAQQAGDAEQPATDTATRRRVIDQLVWDDRVDAANVFVHVDDGAVRLSGIVESYTARLAAGDTVRDVYGVQAVENNLEVSPQQPATTDQYIRIRAVNALELSPSVDEESVDVEVEGGIVILRGTVDSYWRKLLAEDLVEGVPGARSVINELAVVPTDDVRDERIAQEVTDAIDRSAAVSIENVNVRVQDGVVMLSGVASDRAAVDAAFDAARYTQGVVDIENFLAVEGE